VEVRPPGPALQAFIDTRRVRPWPLEHRFGWSGVRAGRLYDQYVEVMQADDRLVLSSRDFGLTLKAMGLTTDRDEHGHFYPGVFEVTREEVARARVIEQETWKESRRLWRDADAAHMEEFDHGTTTCECDLTELRDAHGERIRAAIEDLTKRLIDDGTIDREVERRFGAFLRWREGDEDPTDKYLADREAARRRALLDKLRDVESRLADAKERGDRWEVEPLDRERESLRAKLNLPLHFMPGYVSRTDGRRDIYVDGGPDNHGDVHEVPASS
jgi:hypothetical protein